MAPNDTHALFSLKDICRLPNDCGPNDRGGAEYRILYIVSNIFDTAFDGRNPLARTCAALGHPRSRRSRSSVCLGSDRKPRSSAASKLYTAHARELTI